MIFYSTFSEMPGCVMTCLDQTNYATDTRDGKGDKQYILHCMYMYISFFWCGQGRQRERERVKKICRERKNLLFSKSVLTPQLFNSNPTTIVITNYLLLLKKTSRCFNVGTVTSSSDLCYTSRTDEHADANCRRYDLPFRKAVEKEKEKKRRGLIVIFPPSMMQIRDLVLLLPRYTIIPYSTKSIRAAAATILISFHFFLTPTNIYEIHKYVWK